MPESTMSGFSIVMTLLLGIRFLVKPVNAPRSLLDRAHAPGPYFLHRRLRRSGGLYLRLCRCGRRNDDAAGSDLCAGV